MSRFKTILAIDSASSVGSLALVQSPDSVLYEFSWTAGPTSNSSSFFLHIEKILKKFSPPDLILTGLGPGSYTGIRIALSTAIGLSISSAIPLAGLPSIFSTPADYPSFQYVSDARRDTFTYAKVENHLLLTPPTLMDKEELLSTFSQNARFPVLTTDARPFPFALPNSPTIISWTATSLARHALHFPEALLQPPLEPIYLKPPHITLPKK